MFFLYQFYTMSKTLSIVRVPESTNNSLRAWSAADELLIHQLEETHTDPLVIYNDSFGYLSSHAAPRKTFAALDAKSQVKATLENFSNNSISLCFIFALIVFILQINFISLKAARVREY